MTVQIPNAMPRLNEPVPEFDAKTTHGPKKLSDDKGRWLVLFSHPSDFTPVCTTKFIAFAKAHDDFYALNCDLLGLSIDSVFSHLAWTQTIKDQFDVEIPFPVIEGLSVKVANIYGMIQPGAGDTSAVRTTYIINPEGVLRAMVYYLMSYGRNIDEFLRLLKAMPASDQHKVATPEGWEPGRQVIVPPTATADEAAERLLDSGCTCKDWYFCKKSVPAVYDAPAMAEAAAV